MEAQGTAQTEARAIQRYIAPSAGRGAVVQLLKHCDGEWVRYEDHATALAAKDAELAEVHQQYVDANEARIDAEAQLAEARKAMDLAREDILEWVSSFPDADHTKSLDALAAIDAARRALTGGKVDG